MPKMKTNRGAAKRFKIASSGRIRRNASHRRHILTKKSNKRMRHLRAPTEVHSSDIAMVKRMLPYA